MRFCTLTGGRSSSPSGCRSFASLSKLSRRLGLGRFFRTLRLQTGNANGNNSRTGTTARHQNAHNQRTHYFTSLECSSSMAPGANMHESTLLRQNRALGIDGSGRNQSMLTLSPQRRPNSKVKLFKYFLRWRNKKEY